MLKIKKLAKIILINLINKKLIFNKISVRIHSKNYKIKLIIKNKIKIS